MLCGFNHFRRNFRAISKIWLWLQPHLIVSTKKSRRRYTTVNQRWTRSSPSSFNEMFLLLTWPKPCLEWEHSGSAVQFYPVCTHGGIHSPGPAPGPLRLLGQEAGAAGPGDGRHVADVTVWGSGGDAVAASVLICMYVILRMENKRAWALSSEAGKQRHTWWG